MKSYRFLMTVAAIALLGTSSAAAQTTPGSAIFSSVDNVRFELNGYSPPGGGSIDQIQVEGRGMSLPHGTSDVNVLVIIPLSSEGAKQCAEIAKNALLIPSLRSLEISGTLLGSFVFPDGTHSLTLDPDRCSLLRLQ